MDILSMTVDPIGHAERVPNSTHKTNKIEFAKINQPAFTVAQATEVMTLNVLDIKKKKKW